MNIKRTNTSIGCQYAPRHVQPSHFEEPYECANHAAHDGTDRTDQTWPVLDAGLNIVTLIVKSMVENIVITLVLDDHVVHDHTSR